MLIVISVSWCVFCLISKCPKVNSPSFYCEKGHYWKTHLKPRVSIFPSYNFALFCGTFENSNRRRCANPSVELRGAGNAVTKTLLELAIHAADWKGKTFLAVGKTDACARYLQTHGTDAATPRHFVLVRIQIKKICFDKLIIR